ncbi:RadC family protein [Flavitalea antarctica]
MDTPHRSIRDWAPDDRPREKLLTKSAANLSDAELVSILLKSGTPKNSALELARQVMALSQNNLQELGKLSAKEIMQVKGIGSAKAATLVAALELGRRRQSGVSLEKLVVKDSSGMAKYLQAMLKDYQQEVFGVVFLNRSNRVNHFEIISKGGITGTVADPRIILKKALEEDAVSLILCHNHPSGSIRPSRADEELTAKIKEAARFLDIKILDHIIVSEYGYYSFADEGII